MTFKKSRSLPKTAALSIVAGLTFSVLLSACSTHQPSMVPTPLRNKITVAETVERLELYTQPGGLNLSARDEDAVSQFIDQYARTGEGPLYINIPSGAANGIGVRQAQDAISARLQSFGISPGALQTGQYPSRPNTPAPLVVSYRRLTTQPIHCEQGASLTHTGNNQPYRNFGCFQTANLAAMVSDPRQLLSPYDPGYAPAWRGESLIDKVQKGEATATPRPEGQEISAGEN